MQARTGTLGRALGHAAGIRSHIPTPLARFLPTLPWLVVGAADRDGAAWASVLVGPPGFVHAVDEATVRSRSLPGAGDPLHELGGVRELVEGGPGGPSAGPPGQPVGLLAIDLGRRMRARVNGTVRRESEALLVTVEQAYANCMKYIQRRALVAHEPRSTPATRTEGDHLTAEQVALVQSADTCFLASLTVGHGVDVSHRGGPPGFLECLPGGVTVLLPDYAGNDMFNTLGNLELDGRAGLTVPDFETGGLLQISGRAVVDYDPPVPERHPGAQRVLRFQVERVVHRNGVIPLRFGPPDFSPFLPARPS